MKIYVNIIGISGVGKSTLLRSLNESTSKIRIIPQSTYRNAREDDVPEEISHYSEGDFNKLTFVARNGRYGILQDDFDDFIESEDDFAVSVNGYKEVEQLKEKFNCDNGVKIYTILLRHSICTTIERQHLNETLQRLFSGEQLRSRKSVSCFLLKEFFRSREYIVKNVDITIYRERISRSRMTTYILQKIGLKRSNFLKYNHKRRCV